MVATLVAAFNNKVILHNFELYLLELDYNLMFISGFLTVIEATYSLSNMFMYFTLMIIP